MGRFSQDKALRVARIALNTVREPVSAGREVTAGFELIPHLNEMVHQVHELTDIKIELQMNCDDRVMSVKEQYNIYRIFARRYN